MKNLTIPGKRQSLKLQKNPNAGLVKSRNSKIAEAREFNLNLTAESGLSQYCNPIISKKFPNDIIREKSEFSRFGTHKLPKQSVNLRYSKLQKVRNCGLGLMRWA